MNKGNNSYKKRIYFYVVSMTNPFFMNIFKEGHEI